MDSDGDGWIDGCDLCLGNDAWGDSDSDGLCDDQDRCEGFDDGLDSLNSRLTSDPRFLGFQQSWSSCMQLAGYNYLNETAMIDDVYARLLDIELIENEGSNQVVSGEALDDLEAYEREVAVVGFDCRLGFKDELARLRFDYEQEFLDDNRFRIAELQQPAQ